MKNFSCVFTIVLSLMFFCIPSLFYGRDEVINESYTIQIGQYVDIRFENFNLVNAVYSVSDASVVERKGNIARWIGKKAGVSTIKYYCYYWGGNMFYYSLSSGYPIYDYYIIKNITITVVDVKSISIPSNVALSIGETFAYTPIITDKEATTTFTWNSSNTSVATIDANGVLSAKGEGWSCITCTASNGVMTQSIVKVSPVLVNEVILDIERLDMSIDEQAPIVVALMPENATSRNVKWLSSNENIAQVDASGRVTAIAPGYCSIFAKADDGSGKYGKCLVHVNGKIEKGDMNGDGEVTVADVTTLLDIIIGKIE